MYFAPLTQVSRLSVPEIMSAWAAAVSLPLSVPASSNWTSSSRMSCHVSRVRVTKDRLSHHPYFTFIALLT